MKNRLKRTQKLAEPEFCNYLYVHIMDSASSYLPRRHQCHSAEETFHLGYSLGENLPENCIVCFFGHLGVGKTTFIKGLAQGAAGTAPEHVSSPTFVYLNIYQGTKTIYHFDLYRLRDIDEFLSMGFDELFFAGGICCLEWSERIASLLPENCIRVEMEHFDEKSRNITIIPASS
jgi:tRNA threonylcarbamoyladenosine biosynthesis protein TsaE